MALTTMWGATRPITKPFPARRSSTALEREGGDELSVSCKIESDAGTVRLVFQSGAEEPEILCDTAGMYTGTIQLPASSNYIIVEMENFTGSLDLTIE